MVEKPKKRGKADVEAVKNLAADMMDIPLNVPADSPLPPRADPNDKTQDTLRVALAGTLGEEAYLDLPIYPKLEKQYGKAIPKLLSALSAVAEKGDATKAQKEVIGKNLYPVVRMMAKLAYEHSKELEGMAGRVGMHTPIMQWQHPEKTRLDHITREREEAKELRDNARSERFTSAALDSVVTRYSPRERGIEFGRRRGMMQYFWHSVWQCPASA